MASNNIELNIGSKFDGEGFRKLNTALKSSSGNVRKVSGAIGGMLTQMDGLDGSVGRVIKTAGGLLGGFLSMGVWGVAIAGISKLVGWMKSLNDQAREAKLAFAGIRKEYTTLEAMAKGYQKRVESYRKAEEEREEAEARRQAAARRQREAEFKALEERTEMEKEYDEYLMKTAALKEKIAGLSDDQIAVNSAQRQVEFANKWGGTMAQTEAGLNLELAKKKAAKNFDALVESIEKELDAADEAINAEKEAAKEKKEAAKKEKEIAQLKEETAKKVKELDEKIAAAKAEAAKLEENAARARGGKTFGEWQRGERQLQREQKRADVRQNSVIENAKKEIKQLNSEEERFGRGFSKARADRLAKLKEFVANQDPNNNPKLKEAEMLEKEKMALIADTQRNIADIAQAIKDNT